MKYSSKEIFLVTADFVEVLRKTKAECPLL